MTKLGEKIGKAAPANESAQLSKLGAALASGTLARGITVDDFAGLGRAFVGVIGMRDAQRIESECVAVCEKLSITQESVAFTMAFEAEKAMRWLALGVRDADDHTKPFGTLAEWEGIDPDTITRAWHQYSDVREQLSPEVTEISREMSVMIQSAVSKKNATLLRSLGTHTLVSYLLSTVDQPQTLPEPSFSTTGSPSES